MMSGGNLKIARGFGSFHSSNYKQQIEACEKDDYEPPEIPVHLPTFEEYKTNPPKFGQEMKEKHFYIEKDWIFLNHGSFGSTLKETMKMKQDMEIYVEKQPVRFIDRVLFPQMVYAQKRIAQFIGCKPSEISFVENATTGTNSILNSLNFTSDDVIYHLNTIYGAVKKSLTNLQKRTNVKIQSETLKFPIQSEDQILQLVTDTLKEGTKLALFDHIPSQTAFVMPIKRIIQLCHDKGIPVLIDGAHALGAVDLNLTDLDADYYVTNGHKWFCSSKGCAVLYVKKHLQNHITGPNISHGYGYGFQSEFSYVGLKDYSPFISLHASLNFWQVIGSDVIRSYIRQLMTSAAKLLMNEWENSFLLIPLEMHASMFSISLPSRYYHNKQITYEDGEKLQNILYKQNKMEIPIKVVQGVMGCRCSFHVYNTIEDYQQLADVINKLQLDDVIYQQQM